tara:strand:- start:139 stop:594 length:456 start_codon:yes stop_codon:yes gene_type:complete
VTSTSYTNKKRKKLYVILGAICIIVFPLYIYLFDFDQISTEQSLCPFKMATGFPCPGCGITKSIVYFYDGDIQKSLNYHLFGPFALVFSFSAIILMSIEIIIDKEFLRSIINNIKIAYFLGIILSIYHIIRVVIFINNNNLDYILKETIWF